MSITIRQAKVEDARCIVEAEQEIAQEPGYFCSHPSELNEENVRQTIESPHGIYLVAERDGLIVGHAFLKFLRLQSLRHVAQLNIGVHKGYHEQGIDTQLMKNLIELARASNVIEKIELCVRASNFRAIALYKKMGFLEEGYLKRALKIEGRYIDDILMALHIKGDLPHQHISRIGVYGVVTKNNQILLVVQEKGPYAGRFDLPGGKIEFGETVDQALHREFLEEVQMDFDSMKQINNFTACIEVPGKNDSLPYIFHHIGLIYSVTDLRTIVRTDQTVSPMKHDWVDIGTLRQDAVTPFVWEVVREKAE